MAVMVGDRRLRGVLGSLPPNSLPRLCQQLRRHVPGCEGDEGGLGFQEARASTRAECFVPFVIMS